MKQIIICITISVIMLTNLFSAEIKLHKTEDRISSPYLVEFKDLNWTNNNIYRVGILVCEGHWSLTLEQIKTGEAGQKNIIKTSWIDGHLISKKLNISKIWKLKLIKGIAHNKIIIKIKTRKDDFNINMTIKDSNTINIKKVKNK